MSGDHDKEVTIFDELVADIGKLVAPIMAVKVHGQDDYDRAMESAKLIAKAEKKVEARRDEEVRPMNERVKAINDRAKQVRKPLDQAKTYLKDRMAEFSRAQLAEQQRARREAEAARAEAQRKIDEQREHERAAEGFGSPEPEVTVGGEILPDAMERQLHLDARAAKAHREVDAMKPKGTTRRWVFDLVDAEAVPVQYRTVDPGKIRAAVAFGIREIPGVRIYEETTVRVR